MNWQQLKAHPGPRTFIEIDRLAGILDLENVDEWRLALPEMDVFQRYVLLLAWFMQHRPMPPAFAIAALDVLPDAGDAVDMIRSIVLQSRPFTKELAEKLLNTNCWCHEAPHRMPFSGAIVQYLGERLVCNPAVEQVREKLRLEHMWTHGELRSDDDDIFVRLSDGNTYVCTFVTPEKLHRAAINDTGMPYPFSDYVSDPHMAVVSRIDMKLIRDVVEAMLSDGDSFYSYFAKCSPVADRGAAD